MGLLQRLLGTEDPKLPVHQFTAALAEYKRGAITDQQVVDAFDLSGDEVTQLQSWLTNLDSDAIERQMIHDVLLLGETGHYTVSVVASRLGV